MIGIGQRIGQLTVAMSKIGGGAGIVVPPPAIPILTAPANLATVNNGVAVTVSATTTDAILSRMDWILDPSGAAIVVASDTDGAPYTQSWTPSTTVADHTLIARAVRGAQSTDSAPITIHVAAGAPAVPVLTAPANLATVTNGTPVTVSATSTDGDLTRIDWILDPSGAATVIATDSTAPYSASWTPSATVADHVIVARAVRGAFTTDSAPITVHVAAPAGPAVPILTAPAASLNVFNTIALTVSATSTDGDLTRMDWILDPAGAATVVATDAVSPYSQSWTPTAIPVGNHVLVARAVRGATSTDSAPITVRVGEVFSNLVTSVPVLRLWQSDFKVTNSGSNTCNSWGDNLSANAATQATGANMPAIVAGLNGHPKLVCDTTDFLKDPIYDFPPPGTTPIFIWAVAQLDAWAASKALWGGNSASAPQLGTTGVTPQMLSYNGTGGSPNGGFTIGTPAVIEEYFSNSTADYLQIGTVNTTGVNTGNVNPTAGWYINGVSNIGFGSHSYYVLMITQGLPTPTELAALRAAAVAMYPGVSA